MAQASPSRSAPASGRRKLNSAGFHWVAVALLTCTSGRASASLPAPEKQDKAHNMLALLRQVGVDGDRGQLPFVVQHDISGRGSTFILGPVAAKTRLDFIENPPMRSVALICGFEPLRIASVSPRSIERAVSPTGQSDL